MKEINCETTHQTTERTMTQVFSNSVKIVADFVHNNVTVFIDDVPKVTESLIGMSIPQFMLLQVHAQKAAIQLMSNAIN